METQAREIRYDGIHCALVVRELSGAALMLTISGTDIGEFGDAPMQALSEWTAGARDFHLFHLFIDARDVRGASIEVSGDWAVWLAANRARFHRISMLTGSRFVEVTADFVRRFADLQGIMRIYTEAAAFDAAVAEAAGAAALSKS
jgi:hypothetical protein